MSQLPSNSLIPTRPLPDSDTAIEYINSPHSAAGIYDVVVVGAGPVGLATALGLRQRGLKNILVIDQTRAFRQVGQGLDILPNGLKALKSIDSQAYEEVIKKGLASLSQRLSKEENTAVKNREVKTENSSPQWVHKNLKGQPIHSFSLKFDDWLKEHGEGRVSLPWYELQTTLRNLLPQDTVKANHRCVNLVNEPELECVRVECLSDLGVEANPYAHWADEKKPGETLPLDSEIMPQQLAKKSIRAKLVVAADGINSRVRRILYEDTPYRAFARPEYSGFGAVVCRAVPDLSNEVLTELKEKFLQDSPIVTISNNEISASCAEMKSPRMILFSRLGVFGYLLHLALPLSSLKEDDSNLLDLALQALERANFSDCFKKLVRLSPRENLKHRPYYIHRSNLSDSLPFPSTAVLNAVENNFAEMQPAWSLGRVVLTGDAAHGMPPFKAQGANQGLEDAMAIVTTIAEIRDQNNWNNAPALRQAFEKYERLRRPFIARIQKFTLEQADWSDEEWQKYGEEVYQRDFERMLEALL